MGVNETNKAEVLSDKKESKVIDAIIHAVERDLHKHPKKMDELFPDEGFKNLTKKQKQELVYNAVSESLLPLKDKSYKSEEELREAAKQNLSSIKITFPDTHAVAGDLTQTSGKKGIPYHQTNEIGFLRYSEEHGMVKHVVAGAAAIIGSPALGVAVEAGSMITQKGGHNRATSDGAGKMEIAADFAGDKVVKGAEWVGDQIGKIGKKKDEPAKQAETGATAPLADDKSKEKPVAAADNPQEKGKTKAGKVIADVGNGIEEGAKWVGDKVTGGAKAVSGIFKKKEKHDVPETAPEKSNKEPFINPDKEVKTEPPATEKQHKKFNETKVGKVLNGAGHGIGDGAEATVEAVGKAGKWIGNGVADGAVGAANGVADAAKFIGKGISGIFKHDGKDKTETPVQAELNKEGVTAVSFPKIDVTKMPEVNIKLDHKPKIEPYTPVERKVETPVQVPVEKTTVKAEAVTTGEPPAAKAAAPQEVPYKIERKGDYFHISPKDGHNAGEVRKYIEETALKSGMSPDSVKSAMAVYDKSVVPHEADTHSFSVKAAKDLKNAGVPMDKNNIGKAYGDYVELTQKLLENSKTKINCDVTLNATDVATRGYGKVKAECEKNVKQ